MRFTLKRDKNYRHIYFAQLRHPREDRLYPKKVYLGCFTFHDVQLYRFERCWSTTDMIIYQEQAVKNRYRT